MAPRWLAAQEVKTLVDHRMRLHQMHLAESEFHSRITTVSSLYDAAQRTPAVRTYQHLLAGMRGIQ